MKEKVVPLVIAEPLNAEQPVVGAEAEFMIATPVYGPPDGRVKLGVDTPSFVTVKAGLVLQPNDTPPLEPGATMLGTGVRVVQLAVRTCRVAGTWGKLCVNGVKP